MDVREKTLRCSFRGREWTLRCNFNVLAEVQEQCGGELIAALRSPGTLRTTRMFLAAMLNDAAEEQGLEERVTPEELGRELDWLQGILLSPQVAALVTAALQDGDGAAEQEEPPPDPTEAPAELPQQSGCRRQRPDDPLP